MDNYEAIGVLKTLSDLNSSSYIKEAVELSIKSLKAAESTQTDVQQLIDNSIQHTQHKICPQCNGDGTVLRFASDQVGAACPSCDGTGTRQTVI